MVLFWCLICSFCVSLLVLDFYLGILSDLFMGLWVFGKVFSFRDSFWGNFGFCWVFVFWGMGVLLFRVLFIDVDFGFGGGSRGGERFFRLGWIVLRVVVRVGFVVYILFWFRFWKENIGGVFLKWGLRWLREVVEEVVDI